MSVGIGVETASRESVALSTGALEALAHVSTRLGVSMSVERLRRDLVDEGRDPSVRRLIKIATDAGLKVRATRLEWSHLGEFGRAFPVMLRLDDGSWMVAEGFRGEGETPVVMIRDPRSMDAPALAIDELRLTAHWTGEALLVKRRPGRIDDTQPFGFGWMLGQVLREKTLFRDVALAALVLSVLALVPPMLYMVVVDRVLVHHRLSTLVVLVIGITVVLIFDTILGFLRRTVIAVAAAKIDARIGIHVFDRLLGLPIDFFDRNATGLIAHKLGEVRRVRTFLTGQLFGGILDVTTLAVLVPTMFVLDPILAMFVLGIGCVMATIIFVYMGPVRRAYVGVIEAEHRKSAMMIETIQGMRTIKTLALEGRRRNEWDTCVAEAVRTATDLQFLVNQPQTLLAPLEKSIYAGSLCLGAYLAISETSVVYAGTLVAFTMIATRATQPIVALAGMMQQYQEARGALAEVASVVNAKPETRRENGVKPQMRGAIAFHDVRFTYAGAATPALDGIEFAIKPGTVVGMMGRSGSGKTTVTRLLQGLHQSYQGLIKIDGVDMREIDLDHLRSRMGVVLQDSFLFKGTIRENILMARPDSSPSEMIEAARMAGAEEFIERLPRGYETMIEEGASNLSGGQRQRLAIARALVTDPSLLIFDEATSALDPDSEAIISENLRRIAVGRTVVMISHRLTSLTECDQILVLERGRLHDAGRHDDLLKRCETYRHLWFQQNRHLTSGSDHARHATAAVARG
ncbi:peptidase domain-containing ABC transporter [Siculibacillus lacustris]|uniref:Peptidase domain-containing ABC transporter n=1 Tax=Siculibacillus lacustris TaxID=1549641 RepID=A0A4Q9VDD8_9HYPH|nr:peptidase domain-containing ABC transporter [Siculibacillus lacustris]TBW32655.1 peptidase domain-containing ABC transporter [Siculibacillus lacustris]